MTNINIADAVQSIVLTLPQAEADHWAGVREQQKIRRAERRAEREAHFDRDPIGFCVAYGFGETVDGVYTRYEEWDESEADYVDEG